VMPCRDVQLWSCDDCLRAYKAWLCSSLFPRCTGAAVDDGVTKPCLELCWTVSRRCLSCMVLAFTQAAVAVKERPLL
jgi:hypothetical protein